MKWTIIIRVHGSFQETGKQLYNQNDDVKERKAIILNGI